MDDNSSPQENPLARFEIQRLYVKEQSCKVPHAPAIFQEEWKPDINLELNIKVDKLSGTAYEVTLRVGVTAKVNQRTAFTLEVQQAGIFNVEQIPEAQLGLVLHGHCPTILYPYVRKTVADAIYEAGFPALALAPINFEALYNQQQAKTITPAAAERSTKPEETHLFKTEAVSVN